MVLDLFFFGGKDVLMILEILDGWVFFGILWFGMFILGIIDMLWFEVEVEFKVLEEEIDFILEIVVDYLVKLLMWADVFLVFVGLCFFVVFKIEGVVIKEVFCSYKIVVSDSDFFFIFGGKWIIFC